MVGFRSQMTVRVGFAKPILKVLPTYKAIVFPSDFVTKKTLPQIINVFSFWFDCLLCRIHPLRNSFSIILILLELTCISFKSHKSYQKWRHLKQVNSHLLRKMCPKTLFRNVFFSPEICGQILV